MKKYILLLISISFFTNINYAQVITQDSLALVAIYNATDGDNWINNSNWLTGNVSNWYGVTVSGNRVIDIIITNNNLTGSLPSDIGNLTMLDRLWLNNNNLTSIPSEVVTLTGLKLDNIFINNNQLTSLPDFSVNGGPIFFYIQNNAFDFGDLEIVNMNWSVMYYYSYAPQRKIEVDTTEIDGIVTFTINVAGSNNHYQWFKDSIEIAGANATAISIQNTESGIYHCEITDTNYPDLTLTTEIVGIGLINGVILKDYNALVSLYNGTNGDGWTDNTNWKSEEPVSLWYGVTVENYRVIKINLDNNLLTGSYPDQIGDLKELTELSLSHNQLTSIPVGTNNLSSLVSLRLENTQLSTLPNLSGLTNLQQFYLANNTLEFNDLESINIDLATISDAKYSPQANLALLHTKNNNQSVLKVSSEGINNAFQWYKSDIKITGEISDSLIISDNNQNLYYCQITNTDFPDLTLVTENIYLPAQVSQLEYDALVAIYNATDGDNWTNNQSWLSEKPVYEWFGMQCAGDSVLALYLSDNNLTGSIPGEIGQLIYLSELDLSLNNIKGISYKIENLKDLDTLNLSHNELTSSLFYYIRNLTNLKTLNLAHNQLYYTFDLSNLSSLEKFIINDNEFYFDDLEDINIDLTSLPECIYSPQKDGYQLGLSYGTENNFLSATDKGSNIIYNWYKDGNKIDGIDSIRLTLELSDRAEYHCEMADNNFPDLTIVSEKVCMPSGLIKKENDAMLAIYNSICVDCNSLNWFQGRFADRWSGVELDMNRRVKYIELRYYNLNGTLPPEIGDLTALTYLVLTSNKLKGDIPSEINNLSKLSTFHILYNNLTGLPDFSKMPALRYINLQGNNFDFGDLEACKYDFNTKGGKYAPQKEIPFQFLNGVIKVSPDGTNNTYQWFKNDTLIEAATADSLIITDTLQNHYHCEVKDSRFPILTLVSEKAYLTANVPQAEYAALVDLYNATSGDNWTNNTNWLSNKPVNEWYGLTVENNNVMAIELDNNNLDGTIPPEIAGLTRLDTLSLNNNKLTGRIPYGIRYLTYLKYLNLSNNGLKETRQGIIGDLHNLEHLLISNNEWTNLGNLSLMTNLKELSIENNKLTFEDIEPYVGLPSESYTYSPQAIISEPETHILSMGDNITLTAVAGGANNHYQWFHDGEAISGVDNDSLDIENFQLTDAGKYYCKISNSIATDLVLETDTFSLMISFSVSFTVTDNNGHVSNVYIYLNEIFRYTDDEGKALYEKVAVGYDIPFSLTIKNHDDYSGTIDVVDTAVNVEIRMEITEITNLTNSNVQVYPNPSNGTFTVDLGEEPSQNSRLLILDLAGKTIYDQKLDKAKNQLSIPGNFQRLSIIQIADDKKVFYKQKLLFTR